MKKMVPNSISLTPSMRPSQLLLLLLTLSVGESWSSSQTSESRNRLSFVQLFFSSGSSVLSSSELPSIPPPLIRSGLCDTVPIAKRSGSSTASPVPTSPLSTCCASTSSALAPLWLRRLWNPVRALQKNYFHPLSTFATSVISTWMRSSPLFLFCLFCRVS